MHAGLRRFAPLAAGGPGHAARADTGVGHHPGPFLHVGGLGTYLPTYLSWEGSTLWIAGAAFALFGRRYGRRTRGRRVTIAWGGGGSSPFPCWSLRR